MDNKKQVEKYISILKKWNKCINLLQGDTLENILGRHITDSLQILDLLKSEEKILDIGSGAGFPGMVLAINGFENIVLCEKSYKKTIFLLSVKKALNLNISILNDNIYNFKHKNYTCIARAFGSLLKLLEIMERLNSPKGVFHKGENYRQEIEEASRVFKFDFKPTESVTNRGSVILTIRNVGRR
ncbi:MAG: 16S rRNA (guanine(527)-N(7))-methyltransferase RsmG [Holosporales bacterium]|jgi:16S rRNA (guanine527-N7)-methyltransferase|nr:16S rRNA (guanine(527)-N(7))-methyltransferase RsmG [Holosporales bacterium]